MNTRHLLASSLLITATVTAADLPVIPTEPIAKKKELLFSDDFEGGRVGEGLAQGQGLERRADEVMGAREGIRVNCLHKYAAGPSGVRIARFYRTFARSRKTMIEGLPTGM